jgi:hypothetical protein
LKEEGRVLGGDSRTRDGQQQRLPMSYTQEKDASKALLDMGMYIDVVRSQTMGRWL